MKFRHPLIRKAAALASAGVATLLSRTLDWRALYSDPTVDPLHPQNAGRHIHLCWHENLLLPMTMRGSRRMLGLTSEHVDGLFVSRIMRHLGWNVTAGSTTRGGVSALLRLLREGRSHICLTPDGPKGPRRTLAPGAVFLASRLGLPVVCWGAGFDRPWRAPTWDRFAVPRPCTRARAVLGPPVLIPPKADREELERHRLWLERLMNWLTEEAEQWAASNYRRAGEVALTPRATSPGMTDPQAIGALHLPTSLVSEWEALARPAPDATSGTPGQLAETRRPARDRSLPPRPIPSVVP